MGIISKWKTWIVNREPSSKLRTTYGEADKEKKHVIVSILDTNGVCGWGEATPLPMFNGETPEGIRMILETLLLPALIGRDCEDISGIISHLDGLIAANFSAKAAIDTALHDLLAKELNVPEYVTLGGRFRRSVTVNRHIGICSEEEAAGLSASYVAQGYKSIKIKVGTSPKKDILRVKAVREAVGKNIDIRIDANQGYIVSEARQVLAGIEEYNVQFCEQPLPAWDLKGMALMRNSSPVPIAADESLQTLRDAELIAEKACADVFIIKLIKCGGLFRSRQIAAIAEASGIKCVVTSTFDTQIGAAHCLHLATSIPPCALPCDLTCYASQPDKANTAHMLEDGKLIPGNEAGCGVSYINELRNEMNIEGA